MNKSQLIDAVSGSMGINKKSAADLVDAVLETITRGVAEEGNVSIIGFGTFKKVSRAARTARNPLTGEEVQVEPKEAVTFKAGQAFKEAVNK